MTCETIRTFFAFLRFFSKSKNTTFYLFLVLLHTFSRTLVGVYFRALVTLCLTAPATHRTSPQRRRTLPALPSPRRPPPPQAPASTRPPPWPLPHRCRRLPSSTRCRRRSTTDVVSRCYSSATAQRQPDNRQTEPTMYVVPSVRTSTTYSGAGSQGGRGVKNCVKGGGAAELLTLSSQ